VSALGGLSRRERQIMEHPLTSARRRRYRSCESHEQRARLIGGAAAMLRVAFEETLKAWPRPGIRRKGWKYVYMPTVRRAEKGQAVGGRNICWTTFFAGRARPDCGARVDVSARA